MEPQQSHGPALVRAAINNGVATVGDGGSEQRTGSRVYEGNTTKPAAAGASSCRALMGVRSDCSGVLRLMAHSRGDGPW